MQAKSHAPWPPKLSGSTTFRNAAQRSFPAAAAASMRVWHRPGAISGTKLAASEAGLPNEAVAPAYDSLIVPVWARDRDKPVMPLEATGAAGGEV